MFVLNIFVVFSLHFFSSYFFVYRSTYKYCESVRSLDAKHIYDGSAATGKSRKRQLFLFPFPLFERTKEMQGLGLGLFLAFGLHGNGFNGQNGCIFLLTFVVRETDIAFIFN